MRIQSFRCSNWFGNLIKLLDKKIYSFGFNGHGLLGLGNKFGQSTPQEISFFTTEKVRDVICGSFSTFVLTGLIIFI
jgi:alpha-tubulin suppressor-like RCC1 family protein